MHESNTEIEQTNDKVKSLNSDLHTHMTEKTNTENDLINTLDARVAIVDEITSKTSENFIKI